MFQETRSRTSVKSWLGVHRAALALALLVAFAGVSLLGWFQVPTFILYLAVIFAVAIDAWMVAAASRASTAYRSA